MLGTFQNLKRKVYFYINIHELGVNRILFYIFDLMPYEINSFMYGMNKGVNYLFYYLSISAQSVKKTLQRYKELQDIIAILGLDELSEEDRLVVSRGSTRN